VNVQTGISRDGKIIEIKMIMWNPFHALKHLDLSLFILRGKTKFICIYIFIVLVLNLELGEYLERTEEGGVEEC